jgi:uncharacterized protein YecE (DUF72 family)
VSADGGSGRPVRVGTSGWHYPHWQGPYYPQDLPADHWLAHYARELSTVEVNGTFYRLPEATTLAAWREQTPEGFLFSIKASRTITHMRKLRNCAEPLGLLLARARLLGPKLGPLLFQLPPHWGANPRRLEELLVGLPVGLRYAFEFRDPSWHIEEVYEVLRARNAAFCIYDLAAFTSPLSVTADFVYVRLHGPSPQPYQASYSETQLRDWAARARNWAGRGGKDVFIYFDNDQAGYAIRNALSIRKYLAEELLRPEGAAGGSPAPHPPAA